MRVFFLVSLTHWALLSLLKAFHTFNHTKANFYALVFFQHVFSNVNIKTKTSISTSKISVELRYAWLRIYTQFFLNHKGTLKYSLELVKLHQHFKNQRPPVWIIMTSWSHFSLLQNSLHQNNIWWYQIISFK